MVKKIKTIYICQNCGYESFKWLGKCPDCGEWNSFAEEKKEIETKQKSANNSSAKPLKIKDIPYKKENLRIKTNIKEFDRILGGGIVPGEIILIGGDPGIGKSTLLLQIVDLLSKKNKIIYISGEESSQQLKMRIQRLQLQNLNFYILNETNVYTIKNTILNESPEIVIIDSIQTMYNPELSGSVGSVGQIKESTSVFLDLAKKNNIAIFIVGHITKEGSIAGPKLLEHMVDCVLYFEGEKHNLFRILRTIKNRFGSTNEIGVFEMTADGLKEVENPSIYFLSHDNQPTPGNSLTIVMEGQRPILLESQALTVFSPMAMPRRVASGIDYNKLSLLIAVIEKIGGLNLKNQEVFVKLSGGFKVDDTSIDLSIVVAIISSLKNKTISNKVIFVGEVGLNGNIRPVSLIEQRIKEAERLGFERIVVPYINNSKKETNNFKIQVIYKKNIVEIIKDFF